MRAPELAASPYVAYEQLRQHGPALFDEATNACYVVGYAAACAVFRDPDAFSSRMSGFEKSLIYQDGERHARVRRLLMPVFSPPRVDALCDNIRGICAALIGKALRRGGCEFMGDIASVVPATVVSWMLGVSGDDASNFPRWANSLISAGRNSKTRRKAISFRELFLGQSKRNRALSDIAECEAFVRAALAFVGAQPANKPERESQSIKEALRDALASPVLTPDEVLDLGITIIVAGTETTAALMGNAALILARDQSLQERIRHNPSQIEPFIDEVLRYESPVQRKGRVAAKDTEVGDVPIPKGARIEVMIGAANRDPEQFPEPAKFWIERPGNSRHLTFGTGPHYCLGQRLAKLEASMLLTSMVNLLPRWSLASHQSEIRYSPNLSVRGPQRLHLSIR
jgi:cytochrome P450